MEVRTLIGPLERKNPKVRWLLRLLTFGFLCLAALTVAPFLWMLVTAAAPASQMFVFPPRVFSGTIEWRAFAIALQYLPFTTYLFNSIVHCTGVVLGQLVIASLAGYAFARLQPPFGKWLLLLFLTTMMVPIESLLIPLYLVMKSFPAPGLPHTNLISTFWGLILPSVVSAFNILILKSFFERLPGDLIDASRIDGCSEWKIFRRIVLPMSVPILTVLGIFGFITTWNSFFWPLIVINDPKLYTLMVGIWKMVETGETWNVVMAVVTLTTLPTLFLYLFFQKYIVRGVVFTGFRG
jgi:multiple sugar transport system permease protein